MKQVERYLCHGCYTNILAAGLHCEEIKTEKPEERKPCDWCERNCYGRSYRISYGRRRGE